MSANERVLKKFYICSRTDGASVSDLKGNIHPSTCSVFPADDSDEPYPRHGLGICGDGKPCRVQVYKYAYDLVKGKRVKKKNAKRRV